MLIKETGNGDYEQPPVGTHLARCTRLIDIGTQESDYQGTLSRKRQLIVGWELPNELMTRGEAAGKPFATSKFYTMSLGEKANLRKDLSNWRGRDFSPEELAGFEAKNLLGACCMLSLTENDKGKVRVTGVMALPKGMQKPSQVNEDVYLSLDPDEFDLAVFNGLSDKMKEMIRKSPEYDAIMNPPVNKGPDFDDVPDFPPPHASGFDDMDDSPPF